MNGIHAQNVGRRFGDQWVLQDVTCKIAPGEITAILGPSGSGKTTLLRMLSFLDVPDSGVVTLNGQKTSGNSRPWPEVTCVFQKQFLWPHLTVRQNLLLPLRRLSSSERDSRFTDAISTFGMEKFLDRYPNEISGGEAQRTALARALALAPTYILLDEAHTFLDLIQQATLNRLLRLMADRGIGVCIATHSLTFAQNHAKTVLVMEHGRIVEEGGPEIIDSPSSQFLKMVER